MIATILEVSKMVLIFFTTL